VAGRPDLEAGVADLVVASRAWRERLGDPVTITLGLGDTAAIASFRAGAIGDHVQIDTDVAALDRALANADAAIALRGQSTAVVKSVGIAIAFGFLFLAFAVAMAVVRRSGRALERDAREASVLNRFTEVTSFAGDDHQLATANLVALRRLVAPDASVTHILNRSMDRAVPEAFTGDAVAEVLPLHALSRCAGVVRGTLYVTDDLADDLSVHCPIYPATSGTLACIPLISGEAVGAVHLYWARPAALDLAKRSSVARITEHAALAIGNRRLLTALHGQANTDARTGLANSRSFDQVVEDSLRSLAAGERLAVLMIDVDHFKAFNDRHGHPAGDEALRAFASVLRSCMRENDLAARYGGEEFAVLLPGVTPEAAATVAERIRSRTESSIISLAPGLTDRLTISIGIASAPEHGTDRLTLLRLADEALYLAKDRGRNRVASYGAGGEPDDADSNRPVVASLGG
jgi:diguanylate cyclase (GGDEF)-like protein